MQDNIAHKPSPDTKKPQVIASPQARDDDEPKARNDNEKYIGFKQRKLTSTLQLALTVTAAKVSLRVSRHLAPTERLAFAPAEQGLPYRATPTIFPWVFKLTNLASTRKLLRP